MAKLIFSIGLIAALIMGAVYVYTAKDTIQSDILRRSVHAVRGDAMNDPATRTVSVDADGRDVRLSGYVANAAVRDALIQDTKNTWGVRVVENSLAIAPPEPAPISELFEIPTETPEDIMIEDDDIIVEEYEAEIMPLLPLPTMNPMDQNAAKTSTAETEKELELEIKATTQEANQTPEIVVADIPALIPPKPAPQMQEENSDAKTGTYDDAYVPPKKTKPAAADMSAPVALIPMPKTEPLKTDTPRTDAPKTDAQNTGVPAPNKTSTRRIDPRAIVHAMNAPTQADIIASKQCQSGISVILAGQSISFATGTATISPDAHDTLNRIARQIKSCPHSLITVEGHTDASGNAASNKTLSEERAGAVVTYLLNKGVRHPLRYIGYGSDKSMGRRVAFTVTAIKAGQR